VGVIEEERKRQEEIGPRSVKKVERGRDIDRYR
jgi:hypothetical protein